MELGIVISQLGLRGATSHRTYERMVETWIELVASGYFEPPYFVKRAEAYANEGIYLQDIAELTAELAMAKAANNTADVAKYETRLAEIYAKRAAIKAQFPKA